MSQRMSTRAHVHTHTHKQAAVVLSTVLPWTELVRLSPGCVLS